MSNYLDRVPSERLVDFFCPVCGCNRFVTVQKNLLEKSFHYISLGKKASKKFECTNCGWTVLLGKGGSGSN